MPSLDGSVRKHEIDQHAGFHVFERTKLGFDATDATRGIIVRISRLSEFVHDWPRVINPISDDVGLQPAHVWGGQSVEQLEERGSTRSTPPIPPRATSPVTSCKLRC
jgi:hypothetical protein